MPVKGKIKLCETQQSDFNVELINSAPFFIRYEEFVRLLNSRCPDIDVVHFLAEPVQDKTNAVLEWYCPPFDGESPIKLSELVGTNEYNGYKALLDKNIRSLENSASRSASTNERQYFDCLLNHMKNEDIEKVTYCYDDHITIGIWGMSMRKGRDLNTIITDTVKDHRIRTITYEIQGEGTCSFYSIKRRFGHVLQGANDIPKVIPADRYNFSEWTPSAPQGHVVEQDITFTAVCKHTGVHEIRFVSGEGGSIEGNDVLELSLGTNLANAGIPLPKPSFGHHFTGWTPAISPETLVQGDAVFTAMFEADATIDPQPEPELFNVSFDAGENGKANGESSFTLQAGDSLSLDMIPPIIPNKGFAFKGWDVNPMSAVIDRDIVFHAQYEQNLPWWKKFWLWLTGLGCLTWLLRILLVLLAILLILFFLKDCKGCTRQINGVVPIDTIKTKSGKQVDDNGFVKPVTGKDGALPDEDRITAPIIDEDGNLPPIISEPGAPSTIGNRLFLFMENQNGDLEGLAKDFKKAYSDDKYSIIGFDKQVKLLVVQIPENERDNIRKSINKKIPNHKFFVFDEEIYELHDAQPSFPAIKQGENPGWHTTAIHLKSGWQYTKGNPDVKVAVVDDGIQSGHPMFLGRIKDAYNVFRQDNHLSMGVGHGTHTAGLAVGSATASTTAMGVAPECTLIPVQVFDNNMCPLSALIAGVMYALHKDADVINVSIGPSFPGLNLLPPTQQNVIAHNQFKNVEQLWTRVCSIAKSKNSIIVFAAGNDDILSSVPPENRNKSSITVTAVDKNLYVTSFTNYGPCSDISAPGKDIYSAYPLNSYTSLDGTSMAAPIVSGAIALMKSLNKSITVEQAANVLYRTGADVYGNIPPMVLLDRVLEAVKKNDYSRGPDRGWRSVPGASPDDQFVVVDDGTTTGTIVIGDGSGGVAPIDGVIPGRVVVGDGVVVDPATGGIVSPGGSGDAGGTGGGSTGGPNAGPGPANGGIAPPPNRVGDGTDYDEIRRMIRDYKQKIKDLEKQLPENQR